MVSEVADNVGYAEVELAPATKGMAPMPTWIFLPGLAGKYASTADVWYSQAAKPGQSQGDFQKVAVRSKCHWNICICGYRFLELEIRTQP
jgi:hypothetical protein